MTTPPTFVTGTVLTAASMNAVGMWLVKSQAISTSVGVGSVTVTDAFNSDFDAYQIVVSGGAMTAGDYGLNMTLGSTTTGYYYSGYYLTYGNTNPFNLNGANVGFWGAAGIGTTSTLSANIFVNNPYLAQNTYFHCAYTYGNPAGGHSFNGGYLANNTQYTSFTLSVAASSFIGGNIRVYGFRK